MKANAQESRDKRSVPASHRILRGSRRRVAAGAHRIGDADPREQIRICLITRRKSGHPPLPGHAYWMRTPPNERKYLSRKEFAVQYGADLDDLKEIQVFAKANKLRVLDSSAARRAVVLSGSVEQMSSIFRVDLGRYETPDAIYRGMEGSVYVPKEIAHIVKGVLGLDNRSVAHRRPISPSPADSPQGAAMVTPPQVARLYQFPTQTNGAGQTIAIIEFGGGYFTSGKRATDVAAFFDTLGLEYPYRYGTHGTGPTLSSILVSGGLNSPAHDGSTIEVTMDIDIAGSIAPGANIAVYFAPNTDSDPSGTDEFGWYQGISSAIHDEVNAPSVVSISWDGGEDNWTQGTLTLMSTLFQEGAVLGVSVFVASGDWGSTAPPNLAATQVMYPASDPWVTACGGTTLTNVNAREVAFTENTWNDLALTSCGLYPTSGATGGGYSKVFPKPIWQNYATRRPRGTGRRGVPDISGNASPYSGYPILVAGTTYPGGGTSAVAPLYAGLVALINASLGMNVGFLNPTLHQLASTDPDVYRDIADEGTNSIPYYDQTCNVGYSPGYTSVPGWDPCTGLGVVVGSALLEALKQH